MNLFEIMSSQNGYFTINQGIEQGYNKKEVMQFIKENKLERVSHGIYMDSGNWLDDLYLLQLQSPMAVLSHETALYLHGLSEREPDVPIVTIKRGYNPHRLYKRNIQIHTVSPHLLEMGIAILNTATGLPVRSYNPERCICDIIKWKKNMDIQVFQTAICTYFHEFSVNLSQLMKYAKVMNIEDKVRIYTEVLA